MVQESIGWEKVQESAMWWEKPQLVQSAVARIIRTHNEGLGMRRSWRSNKDEQQGSCGQCWHPHSGPSEQMGQWSDRMKQPFNKVCLSLLMILHELLIHDFTWIVNCSREMRLEQPKNGLWKPKNTDCYCLNLACPTMVNVLKAWSPAVGTIGRQWKV